ncbi:class I SAM-dependent methyltransferase [Candidatus Parabeggiatoa sp. HSG14]|uniref:class I SAM-dependent methyltransferase n=1 Tax=Candidatus Parabeggiatoa sp. HSG14 TaxID=3055593 RepID=UPI0025A71756|nr:class I SAM-dependent methyltransferase [Thiotrichales bacterium HSG14]
MNILDEYVDTFPTDQNALNIFKEEWLSRLPPTEAESELTSGHIPLFQDRKIAWAAQQFGGVKGCKILELGPLEGGHTYMLENMGAASILSIEANTRAYLKCLVTKEILGLKQAHFMLGDFVTYLKETDETFDICIASGVLYHMQNPAELIDLISQRSSKVMMWTHYYDQSLIESNPYLREDKFPGTINKDYKGRQYKLYQQNYQESLDSAKFAGGHETFSLWMTRADILTCLEDFGFQNVTIEFEEPNHPNGPCFCFVGTKKPS